MVFARVRQRRTARVGPTLPINTLTVVPNWPYCAFFDIALSHHVLLWLLLAVAPAVIAAVVNTEY